MSEMSFREMLKETKVPGMEAAEEVIKKLLKENGQLREERINLRIERDRLQTELGKLRKELNAVRAEAESSEDLQEEPFTEMKGRQFQRAGRKRR